MDFHITEYDVARYRFAMTAALRNAFIRKLSTKTLEQLTALQAELKKAKGEVERIKNLVTSYHVTNGPSGISVEYVKVADPLVKDIPKVVQDIKKTLKGLPDKYADTFPWEFEPLSDTYECFPAKSLLESSDLLAQLTTVRKRLFSTSREIVLYRLKNFNYPSETSLSVGANKEFEDAQNRGIVDVFNTEENYNQVIDDTLFDWAGGDINKRLRDKAKLKDLYGVEASPKQGIFEKGVEGVTEFSYYLVQKRYPGVPFCIPKNKNEAGISEAAVSSATRKEEAKIKALEDNLGNRSAYNGRAFAEQEPVKNLVENTISALDDLEYLLNDLNDREKYSLAHDFLLRNGRNQVVQRVANMRSASNKEQAKAMAAQITEINNKAKAFIARLRSKTSTS